MTMARTHSVPHLRKTAWRALPLLMVSAMFTHAVKAQPLLQLSPGTFGDSFTEARSAPRQQARIYAWRATDGGSQLPVNLYIDGRYHASLLRGGYTEFCTAPGSWRLQPVLNDAGRQHAGKLQTGIPLSPQAGQVLYLRIQDDGTRTASVQTVSQELALSELRRTRLQQHTNSRAPAAQECDTELAPTSSGAAPKTAVKAPVQREYALKTDALFEFGKTELRASGFNAIEDLIQQVQQDYLHIDRIRVLGYTDAIGPVKLNRQLSLERARTVAERLSSRGVTARSAIQVEGRGADSLVKTNCQNAPTPANKLCHAPNRRVVIVVYGPRR